MGTLRGPYGDKSSPSTAASGPDIFLGESALGLVSIFIGISGGEKQLEKRGSSFLLYLILQGFWILDFWKVSHTSSVPLGCAAMVPYADLGGASWSIHGLIRGHRIRCAAPV